MPHEKQDRTKCGNHRSIPLLAHAGKVVAKVITFHASGYCESEAALPKVQCRFLRGRLTIDMTYAV